MSLNFHIAPVLHWHRIIHLCLWFLLLANSIPKYEICLPLNHFSFDPLANPMSTIAEKKQIFPISGPVANDDNYLVTPTKPASTRKNCIKLLLFSPLLLVHLQQLPSQLPSQSQFPSQLLLPNAIAAVSTNPYSNMNMLTSAVDQALVTISQLQQSRNSSWRICSTTNSECWIVIPSQRSKHAINAIHPNNYINIEAVIHKPAHKSSLTESNKQHNWQKNSESEHGNTVYNKNMSLNFHIASVLHWHRIIHLCLWFLLLANSILKYEICLPWNHFSFDPLANPMSTIAEKIKYFRFRDQLRMMTSTWWLLQNQHPHVKTA